MIEEIDTLVQSMEIIERKHIAGNEFVIGKIAEKKVVVVYSGIGKVQAALCATILLEHFSVSSIIFSGVAGGVYSKATVGSVVLGDRLCYHDMDCTGFGYKRGVIPRSKTSIFYSDKNLLKLAKMHLDSSLVPYNVGMIVSGDQFICNKEQALALEKEFQAYAVEMEGAAVAHVATLYECPFLVIRMISDNANESAKVDYKLFIQKAIIEANAIVKSMVANS